MECRLQQQHICVAQHKKTLQLLSETLAKSARQFRCILVCIVHLDCLGLERDPAMVLWTVCELLDHQGIDRLSVDSCKVPEPLDRTWITRPAAQTWMVLYAVGLLIVPSHFQDSSCLCRSFYSFVSKFICLQLHSFICSSIHLFVYPFHCLLINLFVRSSLISFTCLSFQLCHWGIRSFTCSFT